MFRWIIHVVMVFTLLLGVASLIAWPVTRFYRSAYIERTIELPKPGIDLNPEGGPWKRDYTLDIYASYGWLAFDFRPNIVNAFWDGPDELIVLWKDGYHQDGDMEFFKPTEQNGLDWYEPIDYGSEWHFDYSAEPSLDLSIPLYALAIPCLLISTLWLYAALKKMLTRRLRIQTNLCLHCGYNLTGVESGNCPECGADRPLVTVSSR